MLFNDLGSRIGSFLRQQREILCGHTVRCVSGVKIEQCSPKANNEFESKQSRAAQIMQHRAFKVEVIETSISSRHVKAEVQVLRNVLTNLVSSEYAPKDPGLSLAC